PAADEPLSMCYYLTILSYLVGTQEWAGPDGADADADRERAVQNRGLWGPLRERLTPLVGRLAQFSTELAWQAPLLQGLMVYVEPGGTLDAEGVRRFSSAVERIDPQQSAARTRLKQIEAALVTRGKATEEAVELLRKRDVVRLRELKDTVLDELGD